MSRPLDTGLETISKQEMRKMVEEAFWPNGVNTFAISGGPADQFDLTFVDVTAFVHSAPGYWEAVKDDVVLDLPVIHLATFAACA